jgi:hypothetical protein
VDTVARRATLRQYATATPLIDAIKPITPTPAVVTIGIAILLAEAMAEAKVKVEVEAAPSNASVAAYPTL